MSNQELLNLLSALIDEKLQPMEKRFDTMQNRFDRMENRFDTMESRFNTMEKRLNNIENNIANNQEKTEKYLTEIWKDIQKIDNRLIIQEKKSII